MAIYNGTPGTWFTATAYHSAGDITLDVDVLDVVSVFTRLNSNDYPISLIGNQEFNNIVDKYYEESTPQSAWVEKLKTPKIFFSGQPSDDDAVIHLYAEHLISDLTTPAGVPDFPLKGYEMLVFELTFALSFDYPGLPPSELKRINDRRKELKFHFKADEKEDLSEPVIDSAFCD